MAAGAALDRADARKALFRTPGPGLVVGRQNGQSVTVVGLPGDRRGDVGAVVRRVIDLGAAVAAQHNQAAGEAAVVRFC